MPNLEEIEKSVNEQTATNTDTGGTQSYLTDDERDVVDFARWLRDNDHKQGTDEYNTVFNAYADLKNAGATPFSITETVTNEETGEQDTAFRENVRFDELHYDPNLTRAIKKIYKHQEGKDYEGSDKEAVEWWFERLTGATLGPSFTSLAGITDDISLPGMLEDITGADEETKGAYAYALGAYDSAPAFGEGTRSGWEQGYDLAAGVLNDTATIPTIIAAIFTGGGAAAGNLALKEGGKQTLKSVASQGLKSFLKTQGGKTLAVETGLGLAEGVGAGHYVSRIGEEAGYQDYTATAPVLGGVLGGLAPGAVRGATSLIGAGRRFVDDSIIGRDKISADYIAKAVGKELGAEKWHEPIARHLKQEAAVSGATYATTGQVAPGAVGLAKGARKLAAPLMRDINRIQGKSATEFLQSATRKFADAKFKGMTGRTGRAGFGMADAKYDALYRAPIAAGMGTFKFMLKKLGLIGPEKLHTEAITEIMNEIKANPLRGLASFEAVTGIRGIARKYDDLQKLYKAGAVNKREFQNGVVGLMEDTAARFDAKQVRRIQWQDRVQNARKSKIEAETDPEILAYNRRLQDIKQQFPDDPAMLQAWKESNPHPSKAKEAAEKARLQAEKAQVKAERAVEKEAAADARQAAKEANQEVVVPAATYVDGVIDSFPDPGVIHKIDDGKIAYRIGPGDEGVQVIDGKSQTITDYLDTATLGARDPKATSEYLRGLSKGEFIPQVTALANKFRDEEIELPPHIASGRAGRQTALDRKIGVETAENEAMLAKMAASEDAAPTSSVDDELRKAFDEMDLDTSKPVREEAEEAVEETLEVVEEMRPIHKLNEEEKMLVNEAFQKKAFEVENKKLPARKRKKLSPELKRAKGFDELPDDLINRIDSNVKNTIKNAIETGEGSKGLYGIDKALENKELGQKVLDVIDDYDVKSGIAPLDWIRERIGLWNDLPEVQARRNEMSIQTADVLNTSTPVGNEVKRKVKEITGVTHIPASIQDIVWSGGLDGLIDKIKYDLQGLVTDLEGNQVVKQTYKTKTGKTKTREKLNAKQTAALVKQLEDLEKFRELISSEELNDIIKTTTEEVTGDFLEGLPPKGEYFNKGGLVPYM